MICADTHDSSISTDIASLLALDGDITTDEYMHFLASASTDPSPALTGRDHLRPQRYPLLFVLKFLLAKTAMGIMTSDITDIVAAYQSSELTGEEGQSTQMESFWPTIFRRRCLQNGGHNRTALGTYFQSLRGCFYRWAALSTVFHCGQSEIF